MGRARNPISVSATRIYHVSIFVFIKCISVCFTGRYSFAIFLLSFVFYPTSLSKHLFIAALHRACSEEIDCGAAVGLDGSDPALHREQIAFISDPAGSLFAQGDTGLSVRQTE